MTTKAQQSTLDNALVAPENQRVIGKCNIRINNIMKPKKPTYQVVLVSLALTACYPAFLITAEVPVIYMHQFWATVNKHNASYRFKIDNKRFSVNVKVLKDILNISSRVLGAEPPKSKKPKTKSDSAISSEETPSKKKPTEAKIDIPSKKKSASKPKPTKKRQRVLDEQHRKISGTDKELVLNQGFLMYLNMILKATKSIGVIVEKKMMMKMTLKTIKFNEEHEEEEENVNEFSDKEYDKENEEESNDGEELYKDVNVNLRKEDVEMTDSDQGRADQHNVSQESGFEKEEKDAHVTLITVHDSQKTKGPMQSSSVSSDFTKKLLNFKNISPDDNEIASLMDTTVPNEEPSALEDDVLEKSFSQLKSTYDVAASLSEYELTKILLDKMEESKSHLRADYKRELYDALVKSYNTDKDLFETYGEVFMLKRS
nr:hypothetical protein [Tanacetum cinerariifolium]